MKTTYLKLLLVPAFCTIGLFAKAQSDATQFSIGPDLVIPVNTQHIKSGNIYSTGVGATAKFEIPVVQGLKLTLSAGYLSFTAKGNYYLFTPGGSKVSYNPGPYHFLPLKAGLRYYIIKGFYAEGDLGEAIKLNSNVYNSFIYSGGLGYNIPIGTYDAVDLGIQGERGYRSVIYDYNMNAIALSAAFKF